MKNIRKNKYKVIVGEVEVREKVIKELNNYFKVLGFNFDDKGKKFVSMVEAK